MADKKISALTGATTPLAGTEVLPIVQGGATVKVAVSDLTAGRAMAALSLTTATLQATNSGGLALKNSSGTTQLSLGSGGGDNITLSVATNITPANAAVAISPTGTGTLTINPATASTINNTSIGATTALSGRFTDVTLTTGNLTISTANKGVSSGGGLFLQTSAVVAAGGTLDLTIDPAGFVGTLSISNTRDNYTPQSRRAVYGMACYGTTMTSTALHIQDGSGGGPAFTLTVPSAGTLRYTDTSGDGSTKSVYITFSGSRSAG